MVALERKSQIEQEIKPLQEAIGGKPDVVYLMSGGIAKGKNVPYKSTSMLDPDFADGKKFGYLGGALRVHAVAKLYQNFPQATIITSSAVNGISHAEIQERELRALWSKWTVEQPETVMREEQSNSSRTELAELIRLVVYKNLTGKVIVVTNDYHVPRVENTLKHLPQLMEKQDPSFAEIWQRFQERDDVSLEIQDAETVVRTVNPKFDAMLATVFEKEPWKSYRQTRLDAEKRGIEAIEQNAYDSQKIRRQ